MDALALKVSARRQFLQQRRGLTVRDRAEQSEQICAHLVTWLKGRADARADEEQTGSRRIIGLYAALADEVQLGIFARQARTLGWQTVYPKADPREHSLTFHLVPDEAELCPGAYGILEPLPDAATVDIGELDVLLVPGVAFTYSGVRLGYGGGFYDRALPHTRAVTIGVAFTCQLADELPTDALDKPVMAVVTIAGIHFCQPQAGGSK